MNCARVKTVHPTPAMGGKANKIYLLAGLM